MEQLESVIDEEGKYCCAHMLNAWTTRSLVHNGSASTGLKQQQLLHNDRHMHAIQPWCYLLTAQKNPCCAVCHKSSV